MHCGLGFRRTNTQGGDPVKTTPYANLTLRISPGLKRALERAAKAEHRSLNAQVEHILSEAVPAEFTSTGRFAPKPRTDTYGEKPSPAHKPKKAL